MQSCRFGRIHSSRPSTVTVFSSGRRCLHHCQWCCWKVNIIFGTNLWVNINPNIPNNVGWTHTENCISHWGVRSIRGTNLKRQPLTIMWLAYFYLISNSAAFICPKTNVKRSCIWTMLYYSWDNDLCPVPFIRDKYPNPFCPTIFVNSKRFFFKYFFVLYFKFLRLVFPLKVTMCWCPDCTLIPAVLSHVKRPTAYFCIRTNIKNICSANWYGPDTNWHRFADFPLMLIGTYGFFPAS